MRADEIAARRRELQAELVELEAAEKAASKLTPAQRVADVLHAVSCPYNHIDQCGYEYETWDALSSRSSKSRYLGRAEALLNEAPLGVEPEEWAIRIAKIVLGKS
jgi:hypothetical protein